MKVEINEFNELKMLTKKLRILIIISIILIISTIIGAILIYNNIKSINNNYKENDVQNEENNNEPYIKKIDYNITPTSIDNVNNIYKHKDQKTAYLTFDDGPSETTTPLILQVLKEENVKASFFMLGSKVEKNPDIVKQVYNSGNYIANHGYSHQYGSIYDNPQNVLDEYNHTEECIRNALGIQEFKSGLFRFPGGSKGGRYSEKKQEAIELLNQNNIAHVDWNALTSDAVGTPTKESIMQSLIETTQDKTSVVILMHDAQDKILTYETLKDVIEYLKSQGYIFGDMHDVMGIENPLVEPNKKVENQEKSE